MSRLQPRHGRNEETALKTLKKESEHASTEECRVLGWSCNEVYTGCIRIYEGLLRQCGCCRQHLTWVRSPSSGHVLKPPRLLGFRAYGFRDRSIHSVLRQRLCVKSLAPLLPWECPRLGLILSYRILSCMITQKPRPPNPKPGTLNYPKPRNPNPKNPESLSPQTPNPEPLNPQHSYPKLRNTTTLGSIRNVALEPMKIPPRPS